MCITVLTVPISLIRQLLPADVAQWASLQQRTEKHYQPQHQFMRTIRSAASVYSFLETARVTRDLAAPSEATSAVHLLAHLSRVVPPSTAQELATFHPGGRRITLASLRAQGTRFPVRFAEIRRIFRVHEVPSVWRFYGVAFGYEAAAVVTRDDLRGAVEALLQAIPHVAEQGHLAPAGAHCAGS